MNRVSALTFWMGVGGKTASKQLDIESEADVCGERNKAGQEGWKMDLWLFFIEKVCKGLSDTWRQSRDLMYVSKETIQIAQAEPTARTNP